MSQLVVCVCMTSNSDHEGGCALSLPSDHCGDSAVSKMNCLHLVDRSVVTQGQEARHTVAGSCSSSSSTIASSCRSSSGCSGRVVVVVVAVVVRGG